MLITEYLNRECIACDLVAGRKEDVVSRLAEMMFETHPEIDKEEAYAGLLERETVLSTGIGNGIAIPHARLESCSNISVAFGLIPGGTDFDAIDNQPVKIVFLIFFPKEEVSLQLKFLARISRLLTHTSLKEDLLGCKTPDDVVKAFQQYEAQHFH